MNENSLEKKEQKDKLEMEGCGCINKAGPLKIIISN